VWAVLDRRVDISVWIPYPYRRRAGLFGRLVPDLSVTRVFGGSNLSTTTTTSDLVKQAMQRFCVAAGEDSFS
jgi:hypothetical protein